MGRKAHQMARVGLFNLCHKALLMDLDASNQEGCMKLLHILQITSNPGSMQLSIIQLIRTNANWCFPTTEFRSIRVQTCRIPTIRDEFHEEQTTKMLKKPFNRCCRYSVTRRIYGVLVKDSIVISNAATWKNWFATTFPFYRNKTVVWTENRKNENENWVSWGNWGTPQTSHVNKIYIQGVTKVYSSDVNKLYERNTENNREFKSLFIISRGIFRNICQISSSDQSNAV